MLKNSLFQPPLSFCFSTFFFLLASAADLFLLQRLSFFFPAFLLDFSFLPYVFKVQPFTCCSLTQPKKPKRFSTFQPKRFCFSSATLSSCFFCFILFWFSPKMLHSAQNVFFFFSLGCPLFFSPSVQLKTFFSCFMSLYLSKSSFSSNLK